MAKKHELKIVTVGEHFASVNRGQKLSERLVAELEPGIAISSEAWKFETLGVPSVGRKAAQKAAGADLIIIAASGAAEPPAHVQNWIKSWLPKKRAGASALVALPDYEDQRPRKKSPLCEYLRKIAGKWGLDFFSSSGNGWPPYFELEAQASQLQQ
jgi:hypothetical protein